MPLLILAATSLIYYAVQRAKELSPEALSSQVLLFVLWNINVLLIFGILFVLLRGIVKLVLERQRGIIGSRFRTKLVVTWVATSLIPVLILFFFATDLLRVVDRPLVQHAGAAASCTNGEAIAQMAQDQSAAMAAAAAREIAASPTSAIRRSSTRVLSHVQQFHSVDMVGLYRDGALVQVVGQSARADSGSRPSRRSSFFDDVAATGQRHEDRRRREREVDPRRHARRRRRRTSPSPASSSRPR